MICKTVEKQQNDVMRHDFCAETADFFKKSYNSTLN